LGKSLHRWPYHKTTIRERRIGNRKKKEERNERYKEVQDDKSTIERGKKIEGWFYKFSKIFSNPHFTSIGEERRE
jgi:hypothetical protein